MWHTIYEEPIAKPFDGKELQSQPILILRKDGVQFVGVYTHHKKNKRKSPCWEIIKRGCCKSIIPAKEIAYWTEIPSYPEEIEPQSFYSEEYRERYKETDNPFFLAKDNLITNSTLADWIDIKYLKPEITDRPWSPGVGYTTFNNVKTSYPVLFCTNAGLMFVGVYNNTFYSSHETKESFQLLLINNPCDNRDIIWSSSVNKKTIRYWTPLPNPPRDVLDTLENNNIFSQSMCTYQI